MTLSYPPLEHQRLDRDFPAELDGQFRVMHMPQKEFDWSWNKPDVTPLGAVSERPLRWLWDKTKSTEANTANRLPELDPEHIRKLATKMIHDMLGPQENAKEKSRRHGGNGHAGNGRAEENRVS